MRFIKDSLTFLAVYGLILLAKLLLVLFGLAEAVGMVLVCYWSVCQMDDSHRATWLLLPVAAMMLVGVQWALWQYWWGRIARRSDFGRALGEYFAISLRHPVVRPPHPWE